jgi:flavin-dependent thymidylate synthase
MLKVALIDFTKDAVEKLIYTKSTRLTQGEGTRAKIANMTREEKEKELLYMASTIPSSWEFVTYTFEITGVSRAFTHQFVRTRTGSYAQQTMRMLPQEKFTYVTGPSIACDPLRRQQYDYVMDLIQKGYNNLLKMGVKIEDARGVLPTNICTNIIAQFSLRTLAEMVKKRTGKRTQDEYRGVMEGMIRAVYEVHPWAQVFFEPLRLGMLNQLEEIVTALTNDSKPHPYDTVALQKFIDQLKSET